MKRAFGSFILFLAALLLISGCSLQTTDAAKAKPQTSTAAGPAAEESWPVHLKASDVEHQPDRFIPISEVGSYNKKIITDELLSKPSTLPDASVSNIPYWTGFVSENMAWIYSSDSRWRGLTDGYQHFYEDNVRIVAEEGFNCFRALYSLSFLSSAEDVKLVNEAQLECLDELIAWGMKYDVHIMISITGLPGKQNSYVLKENVQSNDELFRNDDLAKLYQQYMEMLLARYKDIPSRNLSFELLAEPSVPDYSVERYETVLLPIVQSLHVIDPDRILIVNDVGRQIPEKLAEAGCALSLHTHIFAVNGEQIGDTLAMDYRGYWPIEYFPSFAGGPDRKPMTLVSENGFEAGTVEIYFGLGDMRIQADGKTILETGMHDIWANNDPASGWETAEIPQGTKQITIGGLNHASAFYAVRLKQNGEELVTLVSHEIFQPESETDPMPTILVNPDGTTENIDNPKHTLDSAYIQARFLQPFIDCAKKYNVGFLLTEVGTDTYDLTKEEYSAYEGIWLQILKDNKIPWMYNCLHGVIAPRGSIKRDVQYSCGFTEIEQVPNTPFEMNIGIFKLLKQYQ